MTNEGVCMASSIGVVIVTFNRLDKLKITLNKYMAQSVLPKYIVVVNNASTDGTTEFLENWKNLKSDVEKHIINSATNLGGSGGFYLGEKLAVTLDAEWIMIADDDAYPEPDYVSGLSSYIESYDMSSVSIVCGKVVEPNGYVSIHRSKWRSKWDRNFHIPVEQDSYQQPEFYPDFVSYIGIVVKKDALLKVGLVNKDGFIWCDDTEHTYRLSTIGRIICIPQYTIIHDVEPANEGLSWKSYYGYRNDLVFFKKHFPIHFPYIVMKLFIKSLLAPLKGVSLIEIKLRIAAIRDAIMGNMGINKTYKPGWKP